MWRSSAAAGQSGRASGEVAMGISAFTSTASPVSSRSLRPHRLKSPPPRHHRQHLRPSNTPPRAVLFPGTGSLPGVLILPGLGNSDGDYAPLAHSLLSAGHRSVSVARVARHDWLRNARGLLLPAYYQGTLTPDPTLRWYFARVDAALSALGGGPPVGMVGHSAGGWLARAYLAARPDRAAEVDALVTLGTPHAPPPAGGFDQTRGLLRFVADECTLPRAVRALCVAGAGIVGKRLGDGSVGESVAFYSYRALCGAGDVDGDGVIPLEAAFFADAERVIVPGCAHSMVGGGTWYGSPGPMTHWRHFLDEVQ